MNIRKVYKIINEEQYNECVKYLKSLKLKQSGGDIGYYDILNYRFKSIENTIYIIVKTENNEFYFRRYNELDNTECCYTSRTIEVEYILLDFNIELRKQKLIKLSNRLRKVPQNGTFLKKLLK